MCIVILTAHKKLHAKNDLTIINILLYQGLEHQNRTNLRSLTK